MSTTTIDQSNTGAATASINFGKVTNGIFDGFKQATKFIPTKVMMGSFSVDLTKVGTPVDNVTLEIQTDSSGSPSGSVLASGSISSSALTLNVETWCNVTSALVLTPGSTYWIVAYRSGSNDNSNYYRWYSNAGSAGQSKKYTTSWVNITTNPYGKFKEYLLLTGTIPVFLQV